MLRCAVAVKTAACILAFASPSRALHSRISLWVSSLFMRSNGGIPSAGFVLVAVAAAAGLQLAAGRMARAIGSHLGSVGAPAIVLNTSVSSSGGMLMWACGSQQIITSLCDDSPTGESATVTAYSAQSAEVLWALSVDSWCPSDYSCGGMSGALFIADRERSPSHMLALNPTTGQTLWQLTDAFTSITFPPSDGHVAVGLASPFSSAAAAAWFVGIDVFTGKTLWNRTATVPVDSMSEFMYPSGGKLLLWMELGVGDVLRAVAVDAATGGESWNTTLCLTGSRNGGFSGAISTNGELFVNDVRKQSDGSFRMQYFKVATATGEVTLTWSDTSPSYPQPPTWFTPDLYIVGATDYTDAPYRLLAFSRTNGALAWSFQPAQGALQPIGL